MIPSRVGLIASTICVVGGVVWGFAVLGGPDHTRDRSFDVLRVSDLQAISRSIEERYDSGDHEPLPATLPSNLNAQRLTDGTSARRDAKDGTPYGYARLGAKNYRLCARFSGPSDLGQDPNGWSHRGGLVCFKMRVGNAAPLGTE